MRPFSCWVWALNALQNSMMLTPCWPSAGPTGGAGFAWPPGIWSLMRVRTFFAIWLVDLLHLVEAELDRDLALEDVDEHLEFLLVGVDVDDVAVEVGQRPRGYLHRLTQLEVRERARALGGPDGGVEDAIDLRLGERHRLVGGADKTRDAGRVLDDRPCLVGHVHVHEDVAGEHALL